MTSRLEQVQAERRERADRYPMSAKEAPTEGERCDGQGVVSVNKKEKWRRREAVASEMKRRMDEDDCARGYMPKTEMANQVTSIQDIRGGLTEPNTSRKLFLRHVGGDRLAVVDGEGRFCLETTPEFIHDLQQQAAAAASSLKGPALVADTMRSMVPNTNKFLGIPSWLCSAGALSEERVASIPVRYLEYACHMAGICPEGRSTSEKRDALGAHHKAVRQELGASALDDNGAHMERLEAANVSLKQRLVEASVASLESRNASAEVASLRNKLAASESNNANLHKALSRSVTDEDHRAAVTSATTKLKALRDELEHTKADLELANALALKDVRMEEEVMTQDNESKELTPLQTPKVTDMLVQAAQLTALTQGSKVFAERVTLMLEKGGVNGELLRDAKVQKLIGAIVPILLMQFGDKIPGVKNVPALVPLAQQKLVIDTAEVLGLAMGDVFSMMGDVVTELNAGSGDNISQLKDKLNG